MPAKVNKRDLVEDVLEVYNQNPDGFTQEYYIQNGKYSKAPVKRIFGSWNNMLKELGIEIKMHKNVTKEEVIEDMLRLHKEFGKLNSNIQRKHSKYSHTVIVNLFGSFGQLMDEMGLSSGYEKNIPRKKLVAELKRLHEEHGYVNSTIIDLFSRYSKPTFLNRFGSMTGVYQALGIPNDPNSDCYFNTASFILGIASDYLEETVLPEWTADWLRNPKTNMKLFIDGYFPKHNLAIEYDGEQHFRYVPFLHHGDVNKFKEQQELDRLKEKLLKDNGITLLRFRYDEPKTVEHIRNKIDQVVTKL